VNTEPRNLTASLEEVNGYPHAKTVRGLKIKATNAMKDNYVHECMHIQYRVTCISAVSPIGYFLLPVYGLHVVDARLNKVGVAAGPQFDNRTVPFLMEFDELSVILLGNIKFTPFLKIPQKFTSWIAGVLNRWPFDKEFNWCHQKVEFIPFN
jgi:hypothetical protein